MFGQLVSDYSGATSLLSSLLDADWLLTSLQTRLIKPVRGSSATPEPKPSNSLKLRSAVTFAAAH